MGRGTGEPILWLLWGDNYGYCSCTRPLYVDYQLQDYEGVATRPPVCLQHRFGGHSLVEYPGCSWGKTQVVVMRIYSSPRHKGEIGLPVNNQLHRDHHE